MQKIALAALILLVGSCGVAQAQPAEPVVGKDYVEIPNGAPLEPAKGVVVVEEFFNYICPACFGFEPYLAAWAAKLPAYAKLVHVPATFRPDFMPYARGYYTAEAHGIADKAHRAVYDAIHVAHKLPAEGDKPDDEKVAAFYAGYGVDKDAFLSEMRSFGIEVKLRRATEHMTRSKIPSTPTLVINGRYLVKSGTYTDMLQIATYLIEKERAK